MPEDRTLAARFARIVAALSSDGSVLDRFCEAGMLLLDADGAAITLNYDQPHRHTVSSTSALALMLEDAQEVAGEGPGFDASRTDKVVTGEFGTLINTPWRALEDSVARLGFTGTILALPVIALGRPVGVLVAHRLTTGLTFDTAAARYLATALGPVLLDHLDPSTVELELTDDWSSRAVVHQATGMVTYQLKVSPDDALALLRAHAYANDSSLIDVATQVVDRELELNELSLEGE